RLRRLAMADVSAGEKLKAFISYEGFRRVRRRTGGGTRTCRLRAIPRPPRHRGRRGLGGAPRRPDYAIRHGGVCRLAGRGQTRAVHLGGGPDVRALKEALACYL